MFADACELLGLTPELLRSSLLGDQSLLRCADTVGFLTSHGSPPGLPRAIEQWVASLDAATTVVVCGDGLELERLACRHVMARGVPLIVVRVEPLDPGLASPSGSPLLQFSVEPLCWQGYGTQGDCQPDHQELYYARNELIVMLSSRLVVGQLRPTGRLALSLAGVQLPCEELLPRWRG